MPYCTYTDIQKQLDDVLIEDLTGQDTSMITQAILDADAEIDGYLSAKYTVPLASVSPLIKKLSVDIAIYNLYSRRVQPPEHRITRYQNAVKILVRIKSGEITIGVSASGDAATVYSCDRVFTRSTLRDW